MLFSSTNFIFLFLPFLLFLYYIPVFKKHSIEYKNAILLLFSLFFYAWGEPIFVFVMVAWIIMNWALSLAMEKKEGKAKKGVLVVAITIDILLLFIFKYMSFVANSIIQTFKCGEGLRFETIALPIGISFFVFQLISYIYDVYYGKCRPQKQLYKLMLYVSMFPQLIAGPIVRYNSVEKEINSRKVNWKDFSEGVNKFVIGLGKKVIISNNLAIIADRAFLESQSGEMTVCMGWLGMIAYTLQIYFDFSGYSDMAIGLGRMFGFHFEENFNYPYMARNITDFWRRWHISLSSWFRDYVYIPLGGSRKGKNKHIINLLIVWLLTGIWHGANWTFIVWGLSYFIFLVTEKHIFHNANVKENSSISVLWNILFRIVTIFVVMLCWVVFRADTLYDAFVYIKCLFYNNAGEMFGHSFEFLLSNYKILLLISILGTTPVVKNLYSSFKGNAIINTLHELYIVLIFSISVSYLLRDTYSPFIYFNF